jgi:hypothetical protein
VPSPNCDPTLCLPGIPLSVLFYLCVSSLLFHHLSLSREAGGFFLPTLILEIAEG